MASTTTDRNGNVIIQFCLDRKRPSIYLGKMPKREVASWLTFVEDLVTAKRWGSSPKAATIEWAKQLPSEMQKKLVKVGLLPKRRDDDKRTLFSWLDEYIASRGETKERTRINLRQARKFLIEHFGADRDLASITAGDADEFRSWMLMRPKTYHRKSKPAEDPRKPVERMAENTVRRTCGRAKQFFRAAVRKKFIRKNPFEDMKAIGIRENKEREYFVDRETSAKVLAACPNDQWRLIFALARFGALRCPSEHMALCWDDFNWDAGIFRVSSPKTEHHDGHGERYVPLFPELRPYVDAVYHAAPDGATKVITLGGSTASNLRTQMQRIIRRAGVTPWPRLFQNLRSSRATELAKDHPEHVAAAWTGHSITVARKHYWRVRDEDVQRALECKNLQNPMQHVVGSSAATVRNASQETKKAAENPVFPEVLRPSEVMLVPPQGLEPWTR